ncbi:uncharacterized protein LOC127880496 [Dreissena polymorpha]|uniref:C2H2-type domain-containing protein n=1 Tax=Dreissena polymorpha TaxID=45954 RepID=A0A9D4GNQ2_DREPO|nr:uncharacterized protein LOC127880496 [Dreissena polymorpha]XP_052283752.1 uncharacterized protein LOC127880496 [Dreissena polymorpha]KAH3820756.1 hypothetical protein DPMN_122505 [Dreissena polymorpha]
MRTIKDPRKKPELRRRVEPVEVQEPEEDNLSTKSTPPKKRKTAKCAREGLETDKFVDNQSDIVSEKSSIVGEDDNISDISSYKSTPPKKRNCNRVLDKSPEAKIEVNGEDHSHIVTEESPDTCFEKSIPAVADKKASPEKKAKGKKKTKSEESPIRLSKSPSRSTEQTSPNKSPSRSTEQSSPNKSPSRSTEQTSPKSKKLPKSKDVGNIKNGEVVTARKKPGPKKKQKEAEVVDDAIKKKQGRKRKLSGPQGDNTEVNTIQLNKDSGKKITATLAKKLEHTQSDLYKEVEQKLKGKVSLKDIHKTESIPPVKSISNNHKHEQNKDDSVVNSFVKNETTGLALKDNDKAASESVLESDDENSKESSDLETSFESINSHREDQSVIKNDHEDLDEKSSEDDEFEDRDEGGDDNKQLEQSIKCEHCGYVSRSKGGHTRHLRKCKPDLFGLDVEASSKPKVHKCEQCEYSAPKRVLVINHMRTHGIFQCKRCKYRTDVEEVLDEHSAMEHKDRSDCKFCKLCNRYVKCSEVPLEKHMEECQGRIPFRCPECSKEFQYESSLKCHVVSHYPDQPKLFSCDQCDYKSNYKANLKKHIRHIHEQRGERNIKCQECDKMFFTEDNMRRHLKLHSEDRPYKCEHDSCDKSFKTMNGLKLHEISHQTDKPFPCEFEGCEKNFKTKRSLVLHMNETHQNAPKNYKCTEEGCEMAFYKKCHLERHIAAHKDDRTHFCNFIACSKAFKTAEALKVHLLFHMDVKPLKCDHCEYTCRQKSSIRFHMKKKHPELVVPVDLKPVKAISKTSESGACNAGQEIDSVAETISHVARSEVDEVEDKSEMDKDAANNVTGRVEDSGLHARLDNDVSVDRYAKTELINSVQKMETESIETIEIPVAISTSTPVKKDRNTPLKSKEKKTPEASTSHTKLMKDGKKAIHKEHIKDSKKAIHMEHMKDCKKPSQLEDRSVSETPVKESPQKVKRTDMYEFQSEDESEDEMKPGLLRKAYDRDKPPLPPVDSSRIPDLSLPLPEDKTVLDEPEKLKKERKKPGPKPKPKPLKVDVEVEKPPEIKTESKPQKKRGRKRKSEAAEKVVVEEVEDVKMESEVEEKEVEKEVEKPKPVKKGKSPKGKRGRPAKVIVEDDEDDDEEVVPVKKKRGRKPKKVFSKEAKESTGKQEVKVPKKRGRKSKAEKEADLEKDVESDNGDATINYSEVESSELFGDSKDSMPDKFMAGNVSDSNSNSKEKTVELSEIRHESDGLKSENEELTLNKVRPIEAAVVQERIDFRRDSDSSDISDFDEDLKPPPAPRPPPMYDSEDGDIESGPENEDFNTSALSNEPLRDFESSREISREISRDFESSREIDDSVKTCSDQINSVETSTPKEHVHSVGTPASVNPYKNDSVNNEHEDPPLSHQSHHSSIAHTPSHNSVPPTPANQEFHESRSVGPRSVEPPQATERVIKGRPTGQTQEENTDESSMPEVDKDYVGRFFEEIQCNQVQPDNHNQISRINSAEENSKSQDKMIEAPNSDSGVPSSLSSNQTELQMQSPPTDLSHKRMELMSPESLPPVSHYQSRSESSHIRSSERIPSVPSYDTQFQHNPIESFSPPSVPQIRDTILRQPELSKPTSPLNGSPTYRFSESQRMPVTYDRNLQNLHRIAECPLPPHNSSSPLLRREDMFSGAVGMPSTMARNPFHTSWAGQEVRPTHWGHPTYLQQNAGSSSYLAGREFMFDPSRTSERNMFSSLTAPSHTQRPEISHDAFQFDRFDFGSYFGSHTPSLPVDYTRSTHGSSQKSLDERYRQAGASMTDFRSLPTTSTGSDMFGVGVNSSFNLEKFYSREPMYHSQHIADNTSNPFLPGVPSQHSMFSRDYPHRGFYPQNPSYPFMNMNDKNYPSATSKLAAAHSVNPAVVQQRDMVTVPRPNMATPESQLQDPYRHHSSMLYNMMNKYI